MNLKGYKIKLDKNNRYTIIGVSGSATSSLATYMKNEGYDVELQKDWFWQKDVCYSWGSSIPLVVLRNPLERSWSQFCSLTSPTPKEKQRNLEYVSRLSSYDAWLNMWKTIVPSTVVMFFEDIVTVKNFPHERKSINRQQMSPVDIDLIENYIEMERSMPVLSRNIPQLLNNTTHNIE
jgi:hypothetical protein